MPTATASGPGSWDEKAAEEDFKGVPAEPLAPRGFVFMLTSGLQSEAEMEGGQRVPRKEDVFEALTRFHQNNSSGISASAAPPAGVVAAAVSKPPETDQTS